MSNEQQYELGFLILKKRNLELFLFTKLMQTRKNNDGTIESSFEDSTQVQQEIHLIQMKMFELEKEITELQSRVFTVKEYSDEDDVFSKLLILVKEYQDYLDQSIKENYVLLEQGGEEISQILEVKEKILHNIEKYQRQVPFEYFKDYSPEHPKKIKADEILSELHNIVSEIVKIEDQNSVELQNQKESLKSEMKKQNKGVQAISKYVKGDLKSHFINTTK